MIIGRGETKDKQPVLVIGLSHANMLRLATGQPVIIQKHPASPDMDVIIWCGKDEMSMKQSLERQGVVDDMTNVFKSRETPE